MIETPRPLAPELQATLPAPDPASLLEQVTTLRLENAALRAENAVLQERIRVCSCLPDASSVPSPRQPVSSPAAPYAFPSLPENFSWALAAPHLSGATAGARCRGAC